MEYSRSQTLPDKCSTSENTCEKNPPTQGVKWCFYFNPRIQAQDNTEKCPSGALICKKFLLLDFLNGFLEEWFHSVGICQVEQTPEGSGPVSKRQLSVTKGLRGKVTTIGWTARKGHPSCTQPSSFLDFRLLIQARKIFVIYSITNGKNWRLKVLLKQFYHSAFILPKVRPCLTPA